jgi:Domain of Unknown Function (DUF1080)
MQRLTLAFLLLPALAPAAPSPFIGRWDFNVTTPGRDVGANWLGVTDKGGTLEIWWQPSGGNVFQVKDFKAEGKHLTLNLRRNFTWDLDASGNKLTGTQKSGDKTQAIEGVRAPELKRKEPKAWTTPEPLFNGKDLTGWEPIGDPAKSHWKAEDGMLVNTEHGDNLKTTRKFNDFKVHFEVNCPDDANSGFYLRGRYETQLEYEPLAHNPPERRIGSIYGRLTPKDMPRTPGQWETFDITLVGRTVTIVRNGVTSIDHQEIEGITGGALDANEGEPGPFYIQGDHTGGLKFRNITVSVPK